MVGYVGENPISYKVTLQYNSKVKGWYAEVGEFCTKFCHDQYTAARLGNALALQWYGEQAILENAEQYISADNKRGKRS